jgi:hypothetical protein
MNRIITAIVMTGGLALAGTAVTAGAGAPAFAATARPAHFTTHDRDGCHAAYDISRHGLSGVGLPTATALADLQETAAFGSKPYKQDALALLHQIVRHRSYHKADQRLTKVCGRHH